MKWLPILDGKWARHAAKARELGLTVHPTLQPGVYKVPSSRRVCDYFVYYERGKVSCSCPSETRCKHAGLLVEFILDHDPEFLINDYAYLVRMEMNALLQRLYKGELSPSEKKDVRGYIKAGLAVVERLGLNDVTPILQSDLVPF